MKIQPVVQVSWNGQLREEERIHKIKYVNKEGRKGTRESCEQSEEVEGAEDRGTKNTGLKMVNTEAVGAVGGGKDPSISKSRTSVFRRALSTVGLVSKGEMLY